MKRIRILRTFMFAFLLGTIVSLASSCSDDDDSTIVGYGTVSGTVTDLMGSPISGVEVTITDVEGSATTGSDGKYTFSNVSMEKHAVSFAKEGYVTISATILANSFDENKVASISLSMVDAKSKIIGKLLDGNNNGLPLAGVTVSISAEKTMESATDGTFALEYLSVDDYTVTFTKAEYVTVKKTVCKADFVNNVADLGTILMSGSEPLPGLGINDLQNADKWYYNEYRGGGNADAYPHWDWACNYFCSMTFVGNWEEQWEGTTLRIQNDGKQRENPANLDTFDSFTYGSKLITEDNKILSLRVRTHNADAASPAYFGVQVVDLSQAEPTAKKVGDTKTYGSGDYTDFDFDLSEYVGKEVVIAIGIYRKETGDYWKQLVLRAIRFANQRVEGWGWLPEKEVVDGWKLTTEMVRSTMVHTKKSFTGISPKGAGRDVNMSSGYPAAYQSWRAVSHIGHEWAYMPLNKDPEVTPSEGYLIKTKGGDGVVNTKVPESYFYSKYAIAAGSNKLTLKTRNFGSNYTYFKISAVEENGTVTHLSPESNTATEAAAAADGCWKFKHDKGGKDNPNDYASFVYDLSQFDGKNVVLTFGVYKGEQNGDESKLVFYSVDLN
ncbi:carboxypeptidase-like regulatory domain-containing protein [Dysgonomonas sp. 511]|uniref:carboxypeptidase-like regulatory domain-containing protein n=1 Tax=Dysgonomonas sp. 511 TaxID=2302930 RepID=UPI0013D6D1FE|nr:carboxypeptidase-like regulatory domain-containing protein [Dysgonomonas sp. 511]NDV77594.1 carboxypeptidase regulatory-like domain-containing protein [Dysgonomonas sp. 511]